MPLRDDSKPFNASSYRNLLVVVVSENGFVQQRDVEVDVVVGLHHKFGVVAVPVQAEDVLQGEDSLERVVVGVLNVVDLVGIGK